MGQGFFITFEGGEGAGKSTQARLLGETLTSAGHDVVLTREPGGASGAEVIRELLVTGEPGRWTPLAEALLFAAARDEHLRTTIRPALARGTIVICDRFADSTRAYQGAAGGVQSQVIDQLEHWVVGSTRPDLTIILDIDPESGLARAHERGGGADRFERHDLDFHARLRAAFQEIAARESERCRVMDARRDRDIVAREIGELVLSALADRRSGASDE